MATNENCVRTGPLSEFITKTGESSELGICHSDSSKLQIRVQTLGKTATIECCPLVDTGNENEYINTVPRHQVQLKISLYTL